MPYFVFADRIHGAQVRIGNADFSDIAAFLECGENELGLIEGETADLVIRGLNIVGSFQ